MKSKTPATLELETELAKLTNLVRERRQQLERLADCPNPACPCRMVWKDHVEKNLTGQIRRIRRQINNHPITKAAKAKKSA